MSRSELPDWEKVLSSASHLQQLLNDAVLVGGTAAAIYSKHRFSRDADHVLTDLINNFDEILEKLESVAGWKTARIKRPVLILGSLDGIETGVRQLIRDIPLETTKISVGGSVITIPTLAEMIRIKAVLILKRNATRDYLDFAAMSSELDEQSLGNALLNFDTLYPQPNGESALQQLEIQLSTPLPYDLEETNLREYKNLIAPWTEWKNVEKQCQKVAKELFESREK
ncbi:MAG: hypothetical protein JW915_22730 [Chitinispirillaceae bacterium]|nr:hypothetical protein [Chitinispirillaceae bacterium]